MHNILEATHYDTLKNSVRSIGYDDAGTSDLTASRKTRERENAGWPMAFSRREGSKIARTAFAPRLKYSHGNTVRP
jgi:hypothetical protein